MKRTLIALFFLLTIAFVGCQNMGSKGPKKPVVFTIGEEPVYVEDFKYVYEKHNSNADDFYSHKSVHEYLDLYTNFRLKIKEAEALKMDTSSAFIEELKGHRKSLAKPYLTEKAVTEQLVKEAYDRMKEEIRASHILVLAKPEANPQDTLTAYNKLKKVKERIANGEDFGEMAKRYSEDRSADVSKGDLGYFSSFSMVYPFESTAYNTSKGEVSNIFRTQFGFHILKVTERRATKGKYKVAHIMIRASQGMDKDDSLSAKNKIDEIYTKLTNGDEWNSLCAQFSEDANSKANNGELQFIDVNSRIVNEFKDAAFSLNNIGEITKPVQTPYGWHIIRLIEKEPLQSFEELQEGLRARIERDSRSEVGQKALMRRLKTENKFVEIPGILEIAVSKSDSSLLTKTYQIPEKDKDFGKTLFTIMDEKYTIKDLYVYLGELPKTRNVTPDFFVKLGYSDFVNDMLLDYEDKHLAEKYVDFKMLYKEYRDGILMFNLMDEKVWSQSTRDTTGLQNYFEKNKNNYQWGERVDAIIYDCENKLVAEKVKSELHFGKYPIGLPRATRFYYNYKKDELSETDKDVALKLVKRVKTDSTLFVRISATTSRNEAVGSNKSIAKNRLDKIKKMLVEDGVPESNIMTIDASYRFDKEKDDKIKYSVNFEFLSSTNKALENYINADSPLALKIHSGKFEKGEMPALDKIDWKEGEYTFSDTERVYYVKINEVLEPRAKMLNEVKGEVISNYQEYLEKEWLHKLKTKYPVVYNEEEIQKLIKE